MTFFERLAARSRTAETHVCVGLDPDFERHKVSDVAGYTRAVIEATAPFAAAYKPNVAFYEQWGIEGLRALEATLAAIPSGIPVIGDAKRGDISSTGRAYARALFDQWGFDAVTLSPYMGIEAVEPFLEYRDRGVYVLCRTSNAGASAVQNLELATGGPLYLEVARIARSWGSNVGLVVGATAPTELREIRRSVPDAPLLVPGVGAQGGDPASVVAAAGATPGLLLVNASRSIFYAGEGAEFAEAAGAAARQLRDDLVRSIPTVA